MRSEFKYRSLEDNAPTTPAQCKGRRNALVAVVFLAILGLGSVVLTSNQLEVPPAVATVTFDVAATTPSVTSKPGPAPRPPTPKPPTRPPTPKPPTPRPPTPKPPTPKPPTPRPPTPKPPTPAPLTPKPPTPAPPTPKPPTPAPPTSKPPTPAPPTPPPTPKPEPTTSTPKTSPGAIKGGNSVKIDDHVSDDGEIGNPKQYPIQGCTLPNYISKDGKLFVVGPKGETEQLTIKGVNWFGMETSATLPLGLWSNSQNGTTIYSIATFLAKNNFNSVRLPICMDSLIRNIAPNKNIVNEYENRALHLDSYLSALKDIIRALGYRKISVLVSLHTLTTQDSGLLWYNGQVSEQAFLGAVDTLTKNLCTSEFWNVIGLDLKNEPASATWGDGSAKDFRAAAERIGNRMLAGCPNWLAFVEGISENQVWTASSGRKFYYMDWWGGGLTKAKQYPVNLNVANKVVYAPHYYTPAVYPASYFYDDGFVELSDQDLRERVTGTFDAMFGYLAQGNANRPALVVGEFGGLYAKDRHAKRTIQRTVDYTIELLMRPGFAGGYVWSLNPESGYGYNPGNTQGHFTEGLLQDDWRTVNEPYLAALKPMDKLTNLKPLQCFKTN